MFSEAALYMRGKVPVTQSVSSRKMSFIAPYLYILTITAIPQQATEKGWFPKMRRVNGMTEKGKKYQEMVGTTGFEPATSRTPSVRATRLRYVPTDHIALRLL
jgi:hypothetical protein